MPAPEFPLNLFTTIMRETPAQPATNLWRAAELDALIRFGLPKAKKAQLLLDLGCGDGAVMSVLRSHLPASLFLLGLDADENEIMLARRQNLYAKLLTAGADSIPLADASVDVVLSNSVLEHVVPIEKTISECGRLLRSGGWFLATVPGPDFLRCLRGAWLPWVRREAYEREIDARLAHLRYWTKDEWKKQLAVAGIELIEARDYLPRQIVRRWEFLSRITGGLLYHLTGKKKSPLCLQRSIGLRRRWKLPVFLIQGLSRILSSGLNNFSGAPYGGLLVIGRKT